MIIDFHTHIFSPEIKSERSIYAEKDPCFRALYSNEKARLITAGELVEAMDKNGVDVSVVMNIGWSTAELCRETNDYIMESIARYPGRLVGFGMVVPGFAGAVAEIERCARGGMKGIGELRPDTPELNLLGQDMAQVVAALNANKLILLVHASEPVGHRYDGKGTVTPDKLYPFIEAYPDLPLVCAHWGGGLPFYALMPEVKRAFQNVYFDTAASPYLYGSQIYTHVAGLAGAERILFGSDYPLISPARYVRELNAANIDETSKNLILSGNARRLLGI
jgi:uncharacterized protein